jgi:hypothetical protein
VTRATKLGAAIDAGTFVVVGVWFGGLLVLGAVVAPTVFHNVPAPFSADAMTLVFRRFDRIALACSAVAAVLEGFRLVMEKPDRIARLRVGALASAAAAAGVEALVFSPAIESLHQEGAIRGVGPLGERLALLHGWAERAAKTELLLLLAYIALVALNRHRRAAV